ncbi:MAG: glycosyltransferase [Chromatiales bacterium]
MTLTRVTVVTTSYPISPGSISGIFVSRLVHALSRSVEVSVVTPADRTSRATAKQGAIAVIPCRYAPRRWQVLAHAPGGIPVALTDKPALKLLLPAMLLSLLIRSLREAGRSNVIHANWAVCGCIAGLAGFIRRRPVVTTLRGEDVTRAAQSFTDRLLLRMCGALSARVICVSTDMREWLRARFPGIARKTELVENGVDGDFLAVGERRVFRHATSPLRLITVGSLIPRKGVDQIIRALIQAGKVSDATLTIVGSGPEQVALQGLVAEKNLGDRVRFIGRVAASDIPGWLADSDIFVLASHSEGRPNVAVEAMATGLPVIASNIPGVTELVEHGQTGLLFRDGDIAGLARCIMDLGRDADLRRRIGMRGRQLILERGLTWTNCAARHLALYQTVLAE